MKRAIYLTVVSLMYVYAFSQPTIGLINDFESGTTQGWSEGAQSPNKPSNISTGGPAGADDNFLRNISSGVGQAGSKWLMFNTTNSWTGSWSSAGVSQVTLDVRNNSSSAITLRMALGINNNQNNNGSIISSGVEIDANSDWQNITFDVTASDFNNPTTATSTLNNVGAFRILINTNASWIGQTIAASVDVDNITTVGAVQVADLEITCNKDNDVSTVGGSDGQATINIEGGLAPHTLSLTGNGVNSELPGVVGNNVLSGLMAGEYEVTVTDANDSLATCTFEITEPMDPLLIDCSKSADVTTIGGSDGSGLVNISGGAAPYSIGISVGGSTNNVSGVSGDNILENLIAGSYQIEVTDADANTATCNFIVSEPTTAPDSYQAILVAKNQINRPPSTGIGEITATLSGDTFSLSGLFSNLQSAVTNAHIHLGMQGRNGGVSIPLQFELTEDSLSGEFTSESNTYALSTDQIESLNSRALYINIHTRTSPGGEIRGQLTPAVDAVYSANLFGSNAVPPVMTQAQGSIFLELESNQLTVSGSFSGLEGNWTNAHIHMAAAGSNGGVAIPLNVTLGDDMRSGVMEASLNSVTLTDDQLDALQNRRLYVNIHSERAGSGEIRGQIVSGRARNVFRAGLAGSNEVPRVMTLGRGMVIAEVMNDSTFHISGSFNGLEGGFTASHLHNGMPGMNRAVLTPLTVSTSDSVNAVYTYADNQYSLTNSDVLRLYNRGIYVNVHSNRFGSGEIRGQFLPESQIVFNAYMSSIFANTNVRSTAIGDVKATLNGNVLQLNGFFDRLSGAIATEVNGGAHIHLGIAGSSGGIEVPLVLTLEADSLGARFRPQDNLYQLDSTQVAALRKRELYINVHTAHSRSGEIRGQLLPEAQIYFAAPLSGGSVTNPVNTTGNGMVITELRGGRIFMSGSFSGLSSPVNVNAAGGAHIHLGIAGTNGGIQFPLVLNLGTDSTSGTFETADNFSLITDGQIDTLRARGYYVNIHSQNVGSGEIRGQLLPFANKYYTAYLSGRNQPSPNTSAANGQVKMDLNGRVLSLNGAFKNLSSPINIAAAGGAHIHLGAIGESGGIALPLSMNIAEDSTSAVFPISANRFVLDSAQFMALESDGFYVNVHSTLVGSGEIRGQILRETNQFPSASSIESPEDSAIIQINLETDDLFAVSWSASTDRDPVNYFWQLSTSPDFDTMALVQGTGDMTQFDSDFGTISDILTSLGAGPGDSIIVYHRVFVTDGSLGLVSEPASVVLIQAMTTSVFDLEDEGITVTLYPNPTQEYLNLDFSKPLSEETNLQVFNIDGKMLQQIQLGRHVNRVKVDLQNLVPSFYIIRVGNKSFSVLKL